MKIVKSVTGYYPAFHLGGRPVAVECSLSIIEANGRRYLKTPFAMLDAHLPDDDELDRGFSHGYYRTAEDCEAYLRAEYPWWKQAEPLMGKWCDLRHFHGAVVGDGRMADLLRVSPCGDSVGRYCRGHRSVTLKAIRAAIKAIGVTK